MTYNYQVVSGGWSWYSFNDISLWSDYSTKSKSIYDPCPYGYRVPKGGDGAASSWVGMTTPKTSANLIDNGSTWLNTWWPIAGWRSNASGALERVGFAAYYWSSTKSSSAYYSYYLYFDYNGSVNPSNLNFRSYGFPVRCVQEEPQSAKPPITRLSCFLDFALSGFRFLLSGFGFQAENGVAGGLEYGGVLRSSASFVSRCDRASGGDSGPHHPAEPSCGRRMGRRRVRGALWEGGPPVEAAARTIRRNPAPTRITQY